MRRYVTWAVVVSVLVFFVAGSLAQPQQRMMRAKRAFHRASGGILAVLKAHKEELKISDEQIGEIQSHLTAFEEKQVKIQNDNNLLRLELKKLMTAEEGRDYEAIWAVLAKTANNRNEMFIERLKLRDKIRSVLTQEQLEALKSKWGRRLGMRMRLLRSRWHRIPCLRSRMVRGPEEALADF